MFDNRARWYNHKTGRFVSADPTGFGGGVNPYIYAQNNSLKYTDPYGLKVVLRPGKRLPTDQKLLSILKDIDQKYKGKDVEITSGLRTKEEQEKERLGSGFGIHPVTCKTIRVSQHVHGRAADIAIKGVSSEELANMGRFFGATGTIIYPVNERGAAHAHIDTRRDGKFEGDFR